MAFGNGKWPARMSPKGQGFVFFVTNLLSIIFSYIYIYIYIYIHRRNTCKKTSMVGEVIETHRTNRHDK